MVQLHLSRRAFVAFIGGVPVARSGRSGAAAEEHCCHLTQHSGPHPDPRPDVDASNVLASGMVPPYVVELYDGIRKIPQIADGIRCQCGCPDIQGFRSLLTCFEQNGMAIACEICQTEARLVIRLHAAGRTLDQIREAVDARFGYASVAIKWLPIPGIAPVENQS